MCYIQRAHASQEVIGAATVKEANPVRTNWYVGFYPSIHRVSSIPTGANGVYSPEFLPERLFCRIPPDIQNRQVASKADYMPPIYTAESQNSEAPKRGGFPLVSFQ